MTTRSAVRAGARAALAASFAYVLLVGLPIGGSSVAPAQVSAAPVGATDIADVVEKVTPAVVGVRTRITLGVDDDQLRAWDRLFGSQDDKASPKQNPDAPRRRPSSSQGSGFFISPDGYVVTTNHLVEGAQKIEITTDQDKTYPARLVGSDAKTDLALLKVDGVGDFPSVKLTTRLPRIGQWIIAIGNPFGLGGTVTAGIVSARARDIKLGTFNDFLQIDAPVNQGNSGGPTFDLQGEVIGVNSAIFSPTGGSVGIGFAIPAETVIDVVGKLKERGAVIRGWMGVQIQPLTPDISEGFGIKDTKGVAVRPRRLACRQAMSSRRSKDRASGTIAIWSSVSAILRPARRSMWMWRVRVSRSRSGSRSPRCRVDRTCPRRLCRRSNPGPCEPIASIPRTSVLR
jgi:serine protease Do